MLMIFVVAIGVAKVLELGIVVDVVGAFNSRVVVMVVDRIEAVATYTRVRASKDAMDTSVELVVTAIVGDSSSSATAVGASIDVGNDANPNIITSESPLLAARSRPRSNTR